MPLHLAAALAIGLAYGVLAQRTHFCTMGALSDAFLFGSLRRLRGSVLAAATGLFCTQLLSLAGWLDPSGGRFFMAQHASTLPAGIGGILLGYGMVLAGGCPSRNLIRLGSGSLKAGLVLLIMALTALLLAALPIPRFLALPAVPESLARAAGPLLALLGLAWALAPRAVRNDKTGLIVSFGLGLLVPLAWLCAPPGPAAGLNFTIAALLPGAAIFGFALALCLGAVLGAHLAARHRGQLRLERGPAPDLGRMLAGALLMGIGIRLLGGCTIGIGLAGLSLLAPSAILALLAMALGVRAALFFLSTGRLMPLPSRSS